MWWFPQPKENEIAIHLYLYLHIFTPFLNQTHTNTLISSSSSDLKVSLVDPMADNTGNDPRRSLWGVPEKLQLHIAMLTLQFGYAGFHVVSRAALNMGISKLVFPVYRNIIALLLLLPFAYFLEK